MARKSASWGKVSEWYNNLLEDGQDTYQEKVIKPNLLRMLNAKLGQEILDIGCGQGFFAREIAKTGAKIVGVDIAGELIRLAKTHAGKNELYLTMSADNMSGLNKTGRFDAAVCVLALQNIKNFQAAIMEMSRLLKAGGKLILVLNHPCFRIPGASAWGYEEKSNIQYRRVEKYLSEIAQEVDMTQGVKEESKKKFTYSFHRPLQAYFKAFNKAGFCVTRLEEWVSHKQSDKGPRKVAEDKARKEIPLFMALEFLKIP